MAEAQAEMQRMEAKLANDTEIARAKRDFDLKKATYDTEVNTAKAEAEKAYELQVCLRKCIVLFNHFYNIILSLISKSSKLKES